MKKNLFYFLICTFLICFIYIAFNFANKKETIAIVGAMDEEINEFYGNLDNVQTIEINNFKITRGTLGKYNIVLAKSGVGKVASAITVQFIIDGYKPKYIINTGIAGNLSDNLKTGDIVIGQTMLQHDFDVTAFGHPKGYIDNNKEPDKPTFFYSDKTLVEKFKEELNKNQNNNIITGTIATGDIFINKEAQKMQIRKDFGADAIDMESAAIAQTAIKNNVPVIVLRTISDSENNSTKEYKQNKKIAAEKSALNIISILKMNIL